MYLFKKCFMSRNVHGFQTVMFEIMFAIDCISIIISKE